MRNVITKLRRIIPPESKFFAVFLILMMGTAAIFELAALVLLMPLVLSVSNSNTIHEKKYLSFAYSFLNCSSITQFIVILAVGIIVFSILKTAFNYWLIRCQSRFIADLTTILTRNLVSNYVAAPYTFHLDIGTGELLNRVQNIRQLLAQVCQSVMLVFSEALVATVLLVAICIIVPVAALFIFLLGLLSLLVYLPVRKRIERLGEEQFFWSGKYNKAILQAFATIKEVKLSCDETYFVNSVVETRSNLCKAEKQNYDLSQTPRLLIELVAMILAMGTLIFMISIYTSLPDIIMYAAVLIAAMFRIMPSITRIQYNLVNIRGGVFTLNKLYADLTDFQRENLGQASGPLNFKTSLKIQNLCFGYGEQPVFINFSTEVRVNESVAFVGPSGSGKTTLADLIMGFLQPDSGQILVDGKNIFENLKEWRKKIGYVSQNIYLLDDTIRSNIAFCREEDIDDERVTKAMKMSQIHNFVQTLPEKENTRIGEMGNRLSGGQRQRLAIARALYQNPELLILDEATSALDNETEKAFIDALQTLKGSLTIIMIAHRLSSIQYCDRTIRLE